MSHRVAWDDLKTVKAIAEAGSLSGAARQLRVSHATVFRRLGDIEERLGVELFERSRSGYAPTPAGEDVAAAAQRIEVEVVDVERRVAGQDLRPSGSVRVTTTDSLLQGLLSPVFASFRQAQPEIALEVAVSNQLFNLTKREADIAIRPSMAPPESLVGRRIGCITQAVYARAEPLSTTGDGLDYRHFDWVGADERLAYVALGRWMTAQGVDERCRYRVDSVTGMLAAVRDGLGVAVLPCYLADDDQRLARISEPIPELATDLWLLTHPDLRRVARIRALLDFVAQAVNTQGDRLRGRT